jgi:hypothetical protein
LRCTSLETILVVSYKWIWHIGREVQPIQMAARSIDYRVTRLGNFL